MNIRHKVIDQESVDAKMPGVSTLNQKRGKLTSKAVPNIKTFNFIYICHGNFDILSRNIYITTINPFMVLSQC